MVFKVVGVQVLPPVSVADGLARQMVFKVVDVQVLPSLFHDHLTGY